MKNIAKAFLGYLNEHGGSPYSAVHGVKTHVLGDDFKRDEPFCGYNIKRHTTISAWRLPKSGEIKKVIILAAHTDTPCLRSRPICKESSEGYELFGVATYGGGLWHTWFDRGLAVDGLVITKNDTTMTERIINIAKPVCIIPSLCIHLQKDRPPPFNYNAEIHLRPILGMQRIDSIAHNKVSERLIFEIKKEIGSQDEVISWDLCLYSPTPACLCGIDEEFIEAGGLDNRSSLYCIFRALADIENPENGEAYFAVGFDHEEVGSTSTVGAASPYIIDAVQRVLESWKGEGRSVASNWGADSWIISCDAAHAVHPNYPEEHQNKHKPLMNGGVVLKINENQRYGTSCLGIAKMREMAKSRGLPLQEFVVKNGSACGSTIGPILAATTGIETVDCGMPLLAMHSIREVCGVEDVVHMYKFSKHCYTYL